MSIFSFLLSFYLSLYVMRYDYYFVGKTYSIDLFLFMVISYILTRKVDLRSFSMSEKHTKVEIYSQ